MWNLENAEAWFNKVVPTLPPDTEIVINKCERVKNISKFVHTHLQACKLNQHRRNIYDEPTMQPYYDRLKLARIEIEKLLNKSI